MAAGKVVLWSENFWLDCLASVRIVAAGKVTLWDKILVVVVFA